MKINHHYPVLVGRIVAVDYFPQMFVRMGRSAGVVIRCRVSCTGSVTCDCPCTNVPWVPAMAYD